MVTIPKNKSQTNIVSLDYVNDTWNHSLELRDVVNAAWLKSSYKDPRGNCFNLREAKHAVILGLLSKGTFAPVLRVEPPDIADSDSNTVRTLHKFRLGERRAIQGKLCYRRRFRYCKRKLSPRCTASPVNIGTHSYDSRKDHSFRI